MECREGTSNPTPGSRPEATGPRIVVGGLAEAVAMVRAVAPSTASVLITGESGTGKEIISGMVHEASRRSAQKMVCVNCAALPESLIESELFGHRRGAFTGAESDRAGCFETANGGTLLLDEISEIPVSIQAKLLRVLESRTLQRVGSNEVIPVDVRIIATSNRRLEQEVTAGRFRLDLFHRLKVIHIALPALRERKTDLSALAEGFLSEFRHESASQPRALAPQALARLQAYHWPGNVRELRNVMHRACLLATSQVIQPQDLGDFDRAWEPEPAQRFPDLSSLTLAEIERWAILQSIDRNQGNRSAAAAQLGVSTRTIFNKLQSYGREHVEGATGDHGAAISLPQILPFPRAA